MNLITETEIKTYSTIDMNVAGKYLTEAIRSAQNIDLCQIIGSRLLSKLEMIVESGDIELDAYKAYKCLLNEYIKDYLLYAIQENLVIPISYKFTNAGIMITEDEKMYQPDKSKIDLIKDYYSDKANYYKKRLQDYLIGNSQLFPELFDYELGDQFPNLYSSSDSPIWLGGFYSKPIRKSIDYLNLPSKDVGDHN